MIAYVARPAIAAPSVPLSSQPGDAARALALGYMRYASACWRGDEAANVFGTRLSAYRRGDLPTRPAAKPYAVSPHGGGGRGIHWYELGEEVVGFVPGCRGGYQVPVDAIPRLVQCASIGTGERGAGSASVSPPHGGVNRAATFSMPSNAPGEARS